jgi:hypothetical protein
MSPEKQRIAIAEACGWVPFPHQDYKGGIMLPYKWSRSGTEHLMELPDYLNDLNAMHEAEKTLGVLMEGRYAERLRLVQATSFGMCHSTAAERAEHFLKTIGKWEP